MSLSRISIENLMIKRKKLRSYPFGRTRCFFFLLIEEWERETCRGVVSTQSNIHDGAFLRKKLTDVRLGFKYVSDITHKLQNKKIKNIYKKTQIKITWMVSCSKFSKDRKFQWPRKGLNCKHLNMHISYLAHSAMKSVVFVTALHERGP